MQDRKEYILEKAFEVFMAVGYDSASMTVLQKELKMSRGAMYRYFESKDDLFKAVIDRYVFDLLNKILPKFDDDNITVAERIDLTYEYMKILGKFLDNFDNIEVKFLNYTALMIQAAKRYPGFLDKLKIYRDQALVVWEKAIRNSIEKGEIRKDIDPVITARIFAKIGNFADDSDMSEDINKGFLKGIEAGQETIKYIYFLIKV